MLNIDLYKWSESNNIKYIDYDEFIEDKNEIGKGAFEIVNLAE